VPWHRYRGRIIQDSQRRRNTGVGTDTALEDRMMILHSLGRGVRAAGLFAALAALAVPMPARAAGNLTAVLESEVVFLDPHFTTANITRTFNFMVYDTLFSMDSKGALRPQMVGDYQVSDDKLTYTFKLRDGLKFHDGQPVTSADVVASLKRWGPRDAMGRRLMAAMQSLETVDAASFVLKLKQRFPLVLETLGKPNAIVPFIIPERQTQTPSDQKITEIIGSGPFIFRPDLWRPGDTMAVDRNPAYVPRQEKPDFLAGGKVVKVDRVTMKTIPDVSTAATALLAGEIDYLQYVPFDWIPRLQRDPHIKLMSLGGLDMFQGNYRLNQASPPFNDPAVRRVLWKLVDQNAVLQAIGIPPEFHLPNCASFWMCGTPLETNAGTEVAHFSIDEARAALKQTSYHGEPVMVMELPNSPTQMQASLVLVDALRKAGFTVDEQTMDWGTLLQRRVKKEGWSLFAVYSNGVDMYSPLTHFYVAANCSEFPGWSCDQRVTPLMTDFVMAESLEQRRKIAEQIQLDTYDSVPSVMWGQFTVPTGYRTTLSGLVESSFPMFWAVDKAGK
jgi:peptide/nickel transport system substrate-binding protein